MENKANFQCTEITTANSKNILDIKYIYDIFKHIVIIYQITSMQCVNNMFYDLYCFVTFFIQLIIYINLFLYF